MVCVVTTKEHARLDHSDADLTRWDMSTDLFAVGVTLYELLCDGEHPYLQARPMLDVNPRDARQFRKDLDESLVGFLLRSCVNVRSDYFQTAAEMRSALEAVRASLWHQRLVVCGSVVVDTDVTPSALSWREMWGRCYLKRSVP